MNKTSIEMLLPPVDASAIRLGGAFRLPPVAKPVTTDTADQGSIRLGGAFRLLPPASTGPVTTDTADLGRIRLGGAFRLAA